MSRAGSRAGFTVAELLVAFVLAGVLVGAVYQLLVHQNRWYAKQREIGDVRGTTRAAASFLAFELRQASTRTGDLYAIGRDSIVLRSTVGAGVVCAIHPSAARVGVRTMAGEFQAEPGDSVILLAGGGTVDRWRILPVRSLDRTGGDVPYCAWGDGDDVETDLALDLNAPRDSLAGVLVGAPIRTFRRVQYGIFQTDGRWWLGRKPGGAASYEILTGPLLPPADTGLAFLYYDAAGAPVAPSEPNRVRYLDIRIRGASLGEVRAARGRRAEMDTLTLRVTLRG